MWKAKLNAAQRTEILRTSESQNEFSAKTIVELLRFLFRFIFPSLANFANTFLLPLYAFCRYTPDTGPP